MAKSGRRSFLDIIFPAGEAGKKTSELIERGLEALRGARDERALTVGRTTLAPSRLELRLPQARYDELAELGAVRDVEIFLNDELLRDLTAQEMRTFGDQPVYVTVAADTSLQPNELYAAVLPPEPGGSGHVPAASLPVYDRTSVLGEAGEPVAPAPETVQGHRLVVRAEGNVRELHLSGTRWIIGRRGASGQPLPEGFHKVDLDLPPTVSREQLRAEMIAADRLLVRRIGKAPVMLHGSGELREGEQRLIPPGTPVIVGDCELVIR